MENYDGAIEDDNISLKAFDANDIFVARTSAGTIMTGPDTCEKSFTEQPVRISPMKSKSENFIDFVDLTLSSLNQL